MPSGKSQNPQPKLARILTFGKPKTHKTRWALGAAASHNVILFDFDNCGALIDSFGEDPNFPMERLYYLSMFREYKESIGFFKEFLMSSGKAVWDSHGQKRINMKQADAERPIDVLDLRKVTSDTVLVIDSWTRFASGIWQLKSGQPDPEKATIEWTEYKEMYVMADMMMELLFRLPCHIICIAHEESFDQIDPSTAHLPQKDRKVEKVLRQPSSFAAKHGNALVGMFNQVIHFDYDAMGVVNLNSDPRTGILTGGNILKPGRTPISKMSWQALCESGRISLPDASEITPMDELAWESTVGEYNERMAKASSSFLNPSAAGSKQVDLSVFGKKG